LIHELIHCLSFRALVLPSLEIGFGLSYNPSIVNLVEQLYPRREEYHRKGDVLQR